MANSARHLSLNKSFTGSLTNLCLLLGALSSDWFQHENKLICSIKENLTAIFSRTDTANSFFFPIANQGKKSAGSVGLSLKDAEPFEVLAVLTRQIEFNAQEVSPQKRILNVDASKVVREGQPLSGGSHGDLFT